MYLLDVFYDHARRNGSGRMSFQDGPDAIRRWTILEADARGLERLRLLAVVCIGRKHLEHVDVAAAKLAAQTGSELRLEAMATQHAPRDCSLRTRRQLGTVLCLRPSGLAAGRPQLLPMPSPLRLGGLGAGSGVRRDFAVGYGARLLAHRGTDCFDFTGPAPRARRFRSLFDAQASLTDPVAFLRRTHYLMRCGRLPPKRLLTLFQGAFERVLGVPTGSWLDDEVDWERAWGVLAGWQQAVLLPVLDAARHLVDASPHELDPLCRPGVILLHTPDAYCPSALFPAWIELFGQLFPACQFVLSLSAPAAAGFPEVLRKQRLPRDDAGSTPPCGRQPPRPPLAAGTALLVDVDGRMPNLALMKLSAHLAKDGWRRELVRGADWRRKGAERVLASCVFDIDSSHQRVARMREYYGTRLTLGGSGVDLSLRLPPEIEAAPADYDLYPELHDRAIGFLTRGCPRRCRFCIVPRKEGRPRQVAELDELLQGSRAKLILLDDNLLAHPDADRLLEQMAARRLAVNFTQTLDLRLVDKHRARLLRDIRCSNARFTRPNYHFSLNDASNLERIRQPYDLFGFSARDNVEFVCMYGYDTTLAEDVQRFAFLRSLPGAYVFTQRYRPVLGRGAPHVPDFFDARADERINQLIEIVFRQNMKSMEVYYHWLSAKYVETFGRLHQPLIDTLFRYNQRDCKGAYMANLLARKRPRALDSEPGP